MDAAGLCGTGQGAGRRTGGKTLNSPGEYPGRVRGVIQRASVNGRAQNLLGGVSGLLCLDERCVERVEGDIVNDLLGVVGHDIADQGDVPIDGELGRPLLGKRRHRGGGCPVVGGLEVELSALSSGDLLVVVAALVPAGGGERGQEHGVEEHRQGSSVGR